MSDEEKQLLIEHNIKEDWWDKCYIINDTIFTPKVDWDGNIYGSGLETYNEWLNQNETNAS